MNPDMAPVVKDTAQFSANKNSLAKKILWLGLLVGFASSVLPARAEDYYVGTDLVFSNYTVNNNGASSSVDSGGHSQSWKILAGYNVDKTWAIEGGYVDFGSANYNVAGNSGSGNLRVNADSFYVAAKSTVPLNDYFSLYSKLGVARNHFDRTGAGVLEPMTLSADKTSLYFGIGAQYKISQNADLILGLDHFGTNDSVGNGSTVISSGMRYSF